AIPPRPARPPPFPYTTLFRSGGHLLPAPARRPRVDLDQTPVRGDPRAGFDQPLADQELERRPRADRASLATPRGRAGFAGASGFALRAAGGGPEGALEHAVDLPLGHQRLVVA